MAGIYFHIPFCKRACYYCNFHFSTSQKLLSDMLIAMAKEVELRKNFLNQKISTIYFGGGTPSIISANEIAILINKIKQHFDVDSCAEITLETNPDDILEKKLIDWKLAGINRLSMGIQSFFDEDLLWMNRAHNSHQALKGLALAVKHFNNLTIDLIYGTPTLTNQQWKQNVQTALSFNIPHLSCYALTVEPKTALSTMITQQKKEDIDAEKQAKHFELLMQWMNDAGYEHYEISNFAKAGFRSKHNSSYWNGNFYLGIGPSAHSFNGTSRQWNIANNALYIKSIQQNLLPLETEKLSATQQLNEYLMTSLRTLEGISLQQVEKKWGIEKKQQLIQSSKKWIGLNHLIEKNNFLELTSTGKLLADGITSAMFFV